MEQLEDANKSNSSLDRMLSVTLLRGQCTQGFLAEIYRACSSFVEIQGDFYASTLFPYVSEKNFFFSGPFFSESFFQRHRALSADRRMEQLEDGHSVELQLRENAFCYTLTWIMYIGLFGGDTQGSFVEIWGVFQRYRALFADRCMEQLETGHNVKYQHRQQQCRQEPYISAKEP